MRRTMLIMRLFATLGLAFWLVGSVSFQVTAQGNETGTEETVEEESGNGTGNTTGEAPEEPAATQEETPEETEDEEPAEPQEEEPTDEPVEEPTPTGTLSVLVFSCTTGGDAGTGTIFPEDGFAPDESCTEATATIAIDGGEATDVTASAEFSLDKGAHSVADTTTGAALDVEVAADAVTTVAVVAYAAPEEEEPVLAEAPETEEVPESTLLIITHDCAPQIQTADALTALTASDKLRLCPVVTLPADPATDPTAFDYTFGDGNPDTIVGIDPTPGTICESGLGEDSDLDPNTDPCFDTSGYTVTVKGAATTITESVIPLNRFFGAVEVDAPEALTSDPTTSPIVLDTSSEEDVTVHVYHFSPGVNVVVHLCPKSIKTTNSFTAKLKKCPAATIADGDTPVNSLNATAPAFDVTVADATITQDITAAAYLQDLTCESTLQLDLDGDAAADLCLAGYAYHGVAPGVVTITQTPPEGYTFGTAEVSPVSTDPVPAVTDGVVTVDTTADGDVTIHLFNLIVPDEGGGNETGGNNPGGNTTGGNTGGNTGGEDDDDDDEGENTGGGGGGNNNGGDGSDNGQDGENNNGFGAVEIYNLYCLADSEYVAIEILDPGVEVDPYSMGDDTCLQDGNEFQITEHGRDDLDPFDVGFDGYEYLDGLPSTEGDDSHLITETWTGTTVPFEVENGVVTEIVVLIFEDDDSYYEDEEDEYYEDEEDEYYEDEEDEYADDEEAVENGDGLPTTGAPMTTPGSDRDLLLFLSLAGVLSLGGAYRLRRSGIR